MMKLPLTGKIFKILQTMHGSEELLIKLLRKTKSLVLKGRFFKEENVRTGWEGEGGLKKEERGAADYKDEAAAFQ